MGINRQGDNMTISSFLGTYFFMWQDGVEILFFATLFYYVARWLKRDKKNNLLIYFYSYCLLALFAYLLQLTTITYCLFLFAPITLIFFSLIHQETLQRNFIALKQPTQAPIAEHNWLACLLRSCLVALNNNKELLCLIEHQDVLSPFITASFFIDAPVQESLLELIFASSLYEPHKNLWLTSSGRLVGFNAQWNHTSSTYDNLWKDEALLYTTKTDAIIIHLDPKHNSFTLAAHGKLLQHLNAHHAFQIIKKHIHYPIDFQYEKGVFYDTKIKQSAPEQRTT
jgi:hypothetical protein